jgi:serine/threonine-protein kinase
MAPEQSSGREVDHRADIYGMGLVLFELVTGRFPFDDVDKSAAGLLIAHARRPPPRPSAVAPQPVPAELERVILRALEKSPAARFQSADEMREALASVLPTQHTLEEERTIDERLS